MKDSSNKEFRTNNNDPAKFSFTPINEIKSASKESLQYMYAVSLLFAIPVAIIFVLADGAGSVFWVLENSNVGPVYTMLLAVGMIGLTTMLQYGSNLFLTEIGYTPLSSLRVMIDTLILLFNSDYVPCDTYVSLRMARGGIGLVIVALTPLSYLIDVYTDVAHYSTMEVSTVFIVILACSSFVSEYALFLAMQFYTGTKEMREKWAKEKQSKRGGGGGVPGGFPR